MENSKIFKKLVIVMLSLVLVAVCSTSVFAADGDDLFLSVNSTGNTSTNATDNNTTANNNTTNNTTNSNTNSNSSLAANNTTNNTTTNSATTNKTADSTETTDNSKIKIELLNGSGDKTLLNKATKALKAEGYNVYKTGTTTTTAKTAIINKTAVKNSIVDDIKDVLGVGNISSSVSSSSTVDIRIIIGKDYK